MLYQTKMWIKKKANFLIKEGLTKRTIKVNQRFTLETPPPPFKKWAACKKFFKEFYLCICWKQCVTFIKGLRLTKKSLNLGVGMSDLEFLRSKTSIMTEGKGTKWEKASVWPPPPLSKLPVHYYVFKVYLPQALGFKFFSAKLFHCFCTLYIYPHHNIG